MCCRFDFKSLKNQLSKITNDTEITEYSQHNNGTTHNKHTCKTAV